jgi:hypothetical protein
MFKHPCHDNIFQKSKNAEIVSRYHRYTICLCFGFFSKWPKKDGVS